MAQHHAYSYRNDDGKLNYMLIQLIQNDIYTGHRLTVVIDHGHAEDCPPELAIDADINNDIQITKNQLIEPIAVYKK